MTDKIDSARLRVSSPPHLLTAWSRAIIRRLIRAGVREWIISPGARSTPYIMALLRMQKEFELELHSIIDERSAAFFALARAQVSTNKVALLCTSGTAGAHYYPALIEAEKSGVPLLAITADRPKRLQNCASPQTIDQENLYGKFSRAYLCMGDPTADRAIAQERFFALNALLAHFEEGPKGPLHLNLPADKPLEPVEAQAPEELQLADDLLKLAMQVDPSPKVGAGPKVGTDPQQTEAWAQKLLQLLPEVGLISAGPLPPSLRTRLRRIAARFNLVLLDELPGPNSLSWLGLGPGCQDDSRAVIHFGPPPVSNQGQELLKAFRERLYLFANGAPGDFTLGAAEAQHGDLASLIERLETLALAEPPSEPQSSNPGAWPAQAEAQAKLQARLSETLPRANEQQATAALSEEAVVATLLEELARSQRGGRLFLGNSLSIRLACWMSAGFSLSEKLQVLFQRGVSGIDGVFSQMAGFAQGSDAPLLVLAGDVTAAHDVGSMGLVRPSRAPRVFVMLENDGGRIFDHLPIAQQNTVGWELFQTPPRLNFRALAQAHGWRTQSAESCEALAQLLQGELGSTQPEEERPPLLIIAHAQGGSSRSWLAQLKSQD